MNLLDVAGEPYTQVLGPNGRGFETLFANCFTIVSIEQADHSFESELFGRQLCSSDQGAISFVGTPTGASPNPATLTVVLDGYPITEPFFEVTISRASVGDSRFRDFVAPGSVTAELGGGCFDIILFNYRGDLMFADISRRHSSNRGLS